jgi:hypothetical protein
MEELSMHRVAAKSVPRILTADQKQQCVNVCTEIHQVQRALLLLGRGRGLETNAEGMHFWKSGCKRIRKKQKRL